LTTLQRVAIVHPKPGPIVRWPGRLSLRLLRWPPPQRAAFLERLRGLMGPEDRLILGIDFVKEPAVIEAAYNDAAGVTAEFNRNMLRVMNDELDADFEPEAFRHIALFNEACSRIEMRLRASSAQHVRIEALDLTLELAAGAELLTEISTKFTPAALASDLRTAGLTLDELLTDDEGMFGLAVASCG